MFRQLRERISKADLGSAWRFSRGIAGGMTGALFFLGSIIRVPLNNFLSGYGKLIDDKMGEILIDPNKTKAFNDLAKLFRGTDFDNYKVGPFEIKAKEILHDILGLPLKFEAFKSIPDFFKDGLDSDYTGKVEETFWGVVPKKLEEKDTYNDLSPIDKKNLLNEIKKPEVNSSSKLSQEPINVATTANMPPRINVAMNTNQANSGIANLGIKNSAIANDPNQKARYDMAFGDKGIV